MMLFHLTVILALALHGSAVSVKLHHRVLHPKLSETPFLERATVEISANDAHLVSASTVSEDLALFEQQLNSAKDISGALYQIALQNSASKSQSEWPVTSVKLCHLGSATAQTLFLHLADNEIPFALDYFVSPIPHDGSCPRQRVQSPWPSDSDTPPPYISPLRDFSGRLDQLNATIMLRTASSPSSPELKAPPPLTPEGQVVQPVPEKSFVQKYWMYIGIFLLAMILAGGGPEEPGRGAGGDK